MWPSFMNTGLIETDTMKNSEFSVTKDYNSWSHGEIWTLIKLKEVIMVLNKVTKFHKILIKTIKLREWTSLMCGADRCM